MSRLLASCLAALMCYGPGMPAAAQEKPKAPSADTSSAGGGRIILDRPVKAAGLMLFPVVGEPKSYLYAPMTPRLARDAEGRPQFSFLRYVENVSGSGTQDAPKEGEGGGILHAVVTLDVPKSQLERAQQELEAQDSGAKIVGPAIYQSGQFALVSAVTTGANEPGKKDVPRFAYEIVGLGTAPVLEGGKAAVSILLTKLGAKVLWQSFKMPTPDISFKFEMKLPGYWSPAKARIVADLDQVYENEKIQAAGATPMFEFEIKKAVEEMMEKRTIRVEIIGGGADADFRKYVDQAHEAIKKLIFDDAKSAGVSAGGAGDSKPPGGKSMLDRAKDIQKENRDARKASKKSEVDAAEADRLSKLYQEADAKATRLEREYRDALSAEEGRQAAEAKRLEQERRDALSTAAMPTSGAPSPTVGREAGPPSEAGSPSVASGSNTAGGSEAPAQAGGAGQPAAAASGSDGQGTLASATGQPEPAGGSGASAPPAATNTSNQPPSGDGSAEAPPTSATQPAAESAGTSAAPGPAVADARPPRPPAGANRPPAAAARPPAASTSSVPANPTPRPGQHSAPVVAPERSNAGGTPPVTGQGPRPSGDPVRPSAVGGASSAPQGVLATKKADAEKARKDADDLKTRAEAARKAANDASAAASEDDDQIEFVGYASYELKQIHKTGRFEYSLDKYANAELGVRFDENIGDLSRYLDDPTFFREVNLDDPLYKQREIDVKVDGPNSEDFGKFINFVTVQLRKRHQGGDVTTDEVRIDRNNFNQTGNRFRMLYGWKGDNDRERWLEYEWRAIWSFFGGRDVEQPWQTTVASGISAVPPYKRRSVSLEADPEEVKAAGVRAITVRIYYDLGGKEMTDQITLNAGRGELSSNVPFMLADGKYDYGYDIAWRLRGNRVVEQPRATTNEAILFVDELPEAPSE